MEPSLCSLYGFDIFLCDGCLQWMSAPLFSMYADLYPLENGGIDVVVTKSLHWVLSRASSLPCDCHWWVGSPVVGVETSGLYLAMFLTCDVVEWDSTLPLARKPRVFLLWSCSPVRALLCHFSHLCSLTNPVGGTALGPTVTVGMVAVGPGVSSALFFTRPSVHIHQSGPRLQ